MQTRTKEELLVRLTRETHLEEKELIERAVEAGLRQMWRDTVLGQYLRGEISREQAVEEVGLDWVELAERQWRAAQEDLKWALNK